MISTIKSHNRIKSSQSSIEIESQLDESIAPHGFSSWAVPTLLAVGYKFTNLSRQEIDAMLGIKLEETRVYREAREEGKDEEREKIAIGIIQENIPLEAIARITELTIDRIQQLLAQVNDLSNRS